MGDKCDSLSFWWGLKKVALKKSNQNSISIDSSTSNKIATTNGQPKFERRKTDKQTVN